MQNTLFDLSTQVKKLDLRRVDTPAGRFYEIEPGLIYPSVTTIIGKYFDKSYLSVWKEKIGEREAGLITGSSATKGKNIHKMAEKYLLGEDYKKGQISLNLYEFNKLIPVLNQHITKVLGIEIPLYSHELKTAGTTDLVCEWDQERSIVDFKTARSAKSKEDILNYFAQATAYAMMFEECYGLTVKQIVIILLVEHEDRPVVFVEQSENYMDLVKGIFK